MESNTVSVWPDCPECNSPKTDWEAFSPMPNNVARLHWVCGDCGHEWHMDVDKDDPITEVYDYDDDDEELYWANADESDQYW